MSRSVFRLAWWCLACLAGAFLLANAAWLGTARAESREDDPVYREQIQAALRAYDAGQLVEAKAHFEAALQAYPNNARVLRGLGTVELEQVNHVAAARYLELALASNELALTDTLRKETEAALNEANGHVGRVQVITSPANAEVRLQGRPLEHAAAVILQPGVYTLEVSAEGFRSDSRQLLVAARQYQIVQLHLERASPPAPPAPVVVKEPARFERAAPWIVLGSSAAVAVAGAVLIAKGASVYRDLDDDVYFADWQRDRDRYPRLLGAGGALLGVGALGLAAGSWWQLQRRDVRVALGPRSVMVSGRF